MKRTQVPTDRSGSNKQTQTHEVSSEHKETFFIVKLVKQWKSMPGEVV